MSAKVSRRGFLKVLGGTAALTVLASCAPKAAPTQAPAQQAPATSAPQQQATTAPAATAPVATSGEGATLRFLAYQGRWGSHEVEFAKRYIEENKPKTKEVVIEEASFADAATKIQAYQATGTMPDAGYLDTAFFPYLAVKGAFQAIDDLAAAAGVDLSKRFNQKFYGKFTDGKSMAIGGPAGITPAMIIYNKTMVQEKGATMPHDDWTIAEFEEFIKVMTDKDQGIFGSAYSIDGGHGSDGWFRRWGGRYLSEDGTKCMFADPKTQEAFKWQKSMLEAGYLAGREDVTEGVDKMFVTGVLACYITNAGLAGSAEEGIGDAFEFDFVLLPKGPLCESGANPCRGFSPYANAIWSSSQTKYPDLAFGMQARVTSAECAKWSVFNLGRQPGSDLSVWRDPEVLAKFPVWGKIADLMENPAGQFPMPANLRYLEYMNVGTAEYPKLLYGDVPYDEANIQAAQAKVQAILDQPLP